MMTHPPFLEDFYNQILYSMRTNIHPQWYPETRVVCACGARFTVGSTVPEIRVEVCSNCHPFYTGEQRFIDTLGRVEKFQQKTAKAEKYAPLMAAKKTKKEGREKAPEAPKTLKEMLTEKS